MQAEGMTEARMLRLLRARHAPAEWAFFAQVRNGTGYERSVTRTADALALGLWPSRGLELHGFEVKCSRSDWVRERDVPEKADEIAGYCDRWWIAAASDKVAVAEEMPPPWGLLVVRDGELTLVKNAERLPTPKPLDRNFICAVMRAAQKADGAVFNAIVEAELEQRIGAERKQHEAEHEKHREEVEGLEKQVRDLTAQVRAFDRNTHRWQLENMRDQALRIARHARQALRGQHAG